MANPITLKNGDSITITCENCQGGEPLMVTWTPPYDENLIKLTSLDLVQWRDDIAMTKKNDFTDHRSFVRAVVPPGTSSGVATCGVRAKINAGTFDRYWTTVQVKPSLQDYRLYKSVSQVITLLGTEAIDLTTGSHIPIAVQAEGTTIGAYRGDRINDIVDVTAKISVNDTALTEGAHCFDNNFRSYVPSVPINTYTLAIYPSARCQSASSPIPEIKSVYLGTVEGLGTLDEPFKAKGCEIEGLTYSSLIKTDKKGKPTNNETLIKIFKAGKDLPNLKKIDIADIPKHEKKLDELL